MKIHSLFLIAMLATSARGATSAESLRAFQKALSEASADPKLAAPMRESLEKQAARFSSGEVARLSPEMMRAWISEQGANWPDALQKAAAALAETLEREAAAAQAETETTVNEALDQLLKAQDEKALEPIAERLLAAVQKQNASGYSERSQKASQILESTRRIVEAWQTVFAAKNAGRSTEALRMMSQLSSNGQELPPEMMRKLREKSLALARELGVLPFDEAESAVRKLIERTIASTSAKDLDPIIQELRAKNDLWSNARDFCPPEAIDLANRATRFAASWQEYLAAKSAGMTERVRNTLTALTQPDMSVPGVPRSMLLERSMQEQGVKTAATPGVNRLLVVLGECKTLSDLEGRISELESIARQTPGGPQILQELVNLNRGYQDVKASNSPVLSQEAFSQIDVPDIRRLRRELTMTALSKQFSTPPAQDETPAAFLRRQLLAARESKDWRAMKRVIDVASSAGVRDQLCLPADGAALTHFLAGINFEESGVGRFATASYIAALKTASDFIPLEELRVRIAKLRAENAADYEEGLKVALTGGLPVSAVEKDWSGDNRRVFPGPDGMGRDPRVRRGE